MNKIIVAIVAIVALVLIGIALMPPKTTAPTPADAPAFQTPTQTQTQTQTESSSLGTVEVETTTPPPALPVSQSVTISYIPNGFSPSVVNIKKGDTVVFKNDSGKPFWPATDPHPAHTGYPEKGGCRGSAFDACKRIESGESWSFTFNEIGAWRYHDHMSASQGGVIMVE
ncbi:MAG: hypothetical protein FJY98_02965 [Candidatus Liptonbacteria bacterium]|nr:hypothetical protein [Candidatus Liptonbacteria bacterium]